MSCRSICGQERFSSVHATSSRGSCSHVSAYSCAAKPPTDTHTGPSSLANNVIVSEILDAARESARTGRPVTLAK